MTTDRTANVQAGVFLIWTLLFLAGLFFIHPAGVSLETAKIDRQRQKMIREFFPFHDNRPWKEPLRAGGKTVYPVRSDIWPLPVWERSSGETSRVPIRFGEGRLLGFVYEMPVRHSGEVRAVMAVDTDGKLVGARLVGKTLFHETEESFGERQIRVLLPGADFKGPAAMPSARKTPGEGISASGYEKAVRQAVNSGLEFYRENKRRLNAAAGSVP
jgi:hypothetical protein